MELIRRGDALGTLSPDLLVDEDLDLSPYGLDARVLHLPGHSGARSVCSLRPATSSAATCCITGAR